MGKHNHKAIFTAVVLQQALAFVWYSPMLFRGRWMTALDTMMDPLAQPNVLPYMASIMSAVFFSYLLSWIFQVAVIEEWKDGLATGLLIGVGFVAPALTMHYMLMNIHADVIIIDATKEVLGAGATGIILATWRAERTPEEA